jgi:histone acetyltransferase (RNA polymerase elongator complex component)
MAEYQVVCVEKDEHIIAVGTGTKADAASKKWTLAQVRAAIKSGTRFYTKSPSTGDVAEVELYDDTIRTDPDGVKDNNLDNLRACSWKVK